MSFRILGGALVLMTSGLPVIAAESPWQGKAVILTRAGVKLEVSAGEKIAPKTSGVAQDVMFQVLKDEDGRLLIESRRQRGWIAKGDAVLFDQAATFFTEQVARHPKDSHALRARGVVFMSENESDKALVVNPLAETHME
jgi:hypothetical protein